MTEENKKLINSRSRVQNFGEVFTSKKEVKNMINMFEQEIVRPESRFLEPACGDGNFLDEILNEKLKSIIEKNKKNQFDFEKYSILAISSLYGVDIIEENIFQTRKRLEKTLLKYFDKSFQSINDDYLKSIRYILKKNIIFGDALTLTFSDKKKNPIIFSEWSFVDSTNIKRRDFSFKHLIETRPFEGHNLFSDLGEKAFIPEPKKEHPICHYLKLHETKNS
jgi:hypothetical protein